MVNWLSPFKEEASANEILQSTPTGNPMLGSAISSKASSLKATVIENSPEMGSTIGESVMTIPKGLGRHSKTFQS